MAVESPPTPIRLPRAPLVEVDRVVPDPVVVPATGTSSAQPNSRPPLEQHIRGVNQVLYDREKTTGPSAPFTFEELRQEPSYLSATPEVQQNAKSLYYEQYVQPTGKSYDDFRTESNPDYFEQVSGAVSGLMGSVQSTSAYVAESLGYSDIAKEWREYAIVRDNEMRAAQPELENPSYGVEQFKNVFTMSFWNQMLSQGVIQALPSLGAMIGGAKVGAVAGAAAGSVIPGAGTAIGGFAGAVAGGLLGLVGVTTVQTLGRSYYEHLDKFPEDVEGASDYAIKQAGIQSIYESLSMPLYVLGMGAKPVVHAAIQMLVQSTHGAGSAVVENIGAVQAGVDPDRPLSAGMLQEAVAEGLFESPGVAFAWYAARGKSFNDMPKAGGRAGAGQGGTASGEPGAGSAQSDDYYGPEAGFESEQNPMPGEVTQEDIAAAREGEALPVEEVPLEAAPTLEEFEEGQELTAEEVELESVKGATPLQEEVDEAANEAATSPENDLPEPTQAQKEAGNYPKGALSLHSLEISIENPAGSTRSGTDEKGNPWEVEMRDHYGYIKRTEGRDGEQVDVFVGPTPESEQVYVVDQVNPANRRFDEHKAVLGTTSEAEAREVYARNYEEGWQGLGGITEMSIPEFKTWLREGDTTARVTKRNEAALAPQEPASEVAEPLKGYHPHEYPEAGPQVDGLTVLDDVPNTGSISASFDEGEVDELPGIRELSFDGWPAPTRREIAENQELADEIKASGEIKPLIIAVGKDGPYILEGQHRLVALQMNGHRSFPALVVVEDGAEAEGAAESIAPQEPDTDEAAGPAPETPAPDIPTETPSPLLESAVLGQRETAETPSGKKIETEWALVELDDLITSHDEQARANPRYPKALQPRDRSRVASRQQITEIVGRFNPERMGRSPVVSEGAPVVGPDMIVESGNARTLALRELYRRGGETGYRDMIAADADGLGLDAGMAAEMNKPVLVRVRRTAMTPSQRAAFARDANEPTVAQMSATERARADAARITRDDLLFPSEDGRLDTAANAEFIQHFLEDVVPPAERGAMMLPDGELSQDGQTRLRNAVFVHAYGDRPAAMKLMEDPDSNIRNITNAMLTAAPKAIQLRRGIEKGDRFALPVYDMIADAAEEFADLRRSGVKIQDVLAQADMLGERWDPETLAALRQIDENKRSAKRLGALFGAWIDTVEDLGSPQQESLLGDEPSPTLQEALDSGTTRFRKAVLGKTEAQGELLADQPADQVPSAEPVGEPVQPGAAAPQNLAPGRPEGEGARTRAGEPTPAPVEEIDAVKREFIARGGKITELPDAAETPVGQVEEKPARVILPDDTSQRRQIVESLLKEEAQRVFGTSAPAVKLLETVKVRGEEAAGSYDPIRHLIQVAQNTDAATFSHEMAHAAIALGLIPEADLALLKRTYQGPQGQKLIRHLEKRNPGAARDARADLEERIAYAAGEQRSGALRAPTAAARALDRIMEAIRKGLDWINGVIGSLGRRQAQDVFDDLFSGKFATTSPRQAAPGPVKAARSTRSTSTRQERRAKRTAEGKPVGVMDRVVAMATYPVTRFVTKPAFRGVEALERHLSRFQTWQQVKAGMVTSFGRSKEAEALAEEKHRQERVWSHKINDIGRLTMEMFDSYPMRQLLSEWLQAKPNSATWKAMYGRLNADQHKVADQVRNLIRDLGKDAVALGQLSQESFDRNEFAYLHRMYAQHELEDGRISKWRNKMQKVMGDQYRGRGIKDLYGVGRLIDDSDMQDVQDEYRTLGSKKIAAAGKKFHRYNLWGNTGKLRKRGYAEVGHTVPSEFTGPGWALDTDKDGTTPHVWEARWHKANDVVLWRDFSRAEQQAMGVVDDGVYAVIRTLQKMTRDIETGRYFQYIGQAKDDEGKPLTVDSEEMIPEGDKLVASHESLWRPYIPGEWVEVPTSSVPNSGGVKRYGALAGKYVQGPVWNDLRQVSNWADYPAMRWYKDMLRIFKVSKTAWSLSVHTNNIMSNFWMMDMNDLGPKHLLESVLIYVKAARGDPEAKAALRRFDESGARMASYAMIELKKEVLAPLEKQLREEMGAVAKNEHALMSTRAIASAQVAWQTLRGLGNKMTDAYQFEDDVFRHAMFLQGIENGESDQTAGTNSKESFLNYDINAPWVNIGRQSLLPFISFTYLMLPKLYKVARDKPWKMYKWALVMGTMNAFGYALSGGDGEDWGEMREREEKERRLLPENRQGRLGGIIAPRLLRMPWNDKGGNPVFLDLTRWTPFGDIFASEDVTTPAIPIFPWLNPSGPIALFAELMLNKNQFTGGDITKESDTGGEAAGKVMGHIYRHFAPNTFLVPRSYSWDRLQFWGSESKRTDPFGREYSKAMAWANSFGIKVAAYPPDVQKMNAAYRTKALLSEIQTDAFRDGMNHARGGIDAETYKKRMERYREKGRRMIEELREKIGQ